MGLSSVTETRPLASQQTKGKEKQQPGKIWEFRVCPRDATGILAMRRLRMLGRKPPPMIAVQLPVVS